MKRVGIVLAGYALALIGAVAAVSLQGVIWQPDPIQASAGMAAFGDLLLFAAVFGVLALVPTAVAVMFLLRRTR